MVRTRLQHWELELDRVIREACNKPYVLGEHDCFTFACEVVKVITGDDRGKEFIGRYKTKRESLALLARYGSTFEAAGDWFFGERVEVNFAHRGDIGVYCTPDGEKHLGVFNGRVLLVLVTEGLAEVPRSKATCAWRVG
jgi:hypothetical protein